MSRSISSLALPLFLLVALPALAAGKPPPHWTDYAGPAAGPVLTGPRAWTAAPNTIDMKGGSSFATVALSVEDFVSTDGKENLFGAGDNRFYAPVGTGVALKAPAGLKVGDAVVAAFGGGAITGRVTAVDGDKATIEQYFVGSVRTDSIPTNELLLLDGTVHPGALVTFTGDNGQDAGMVLQNTADTVWVMSEGHVVKKSTGDVQIMVTAPLAAGAACLGSQFAPLTACKVKKVLGHGVAYEVKLGDGETATLTMDRVTKGP